MNGEKHVVTIENMQKPLTLKVCIPQLEDV